MAHIGVRSHLHPGIATALSLFRLPLITATLPPTFSATLSVGSFSLRPRQSAKIIEECWVSLPETVTSPGSVVERPSTFNQ